MTVAMISHRNSSGTSPPASSSASSAALPAATARCASISSRTRSGSDSSPNDDSTLAAWSE